MQSPEKEKETGRKKIGTILAAATLVMSCAVPCYEKAEGETGPSGGLGLGVGYGHQVKWGPSVIPGYGRHVSGQVTAFMRYGPTRSYSFFVQGTGGTGIWLNGSDSARALPYVFDFQVGAKFRLPERSAVRLSTGVPSWFDFVFLHDFGDHWTGAFGYGTRGFSLAATHHITVSRGLLGHISLSATVLPSSEWHPSAFLGFGVEWLGKPEDR